MEMSRIVCKQARKADARAYRRRRRSRSRGTVGSEGGDSGRPLRKKEKSGRSVRRAGRQAIARPERARADAGRGLAEKARRACESFPDLLGIEGGWAGTL
ncbi:hypothetical protein OMP38_31110 [Cohnella ginsengisoli]|uniref:Uncharacterized protein n=1 Tax=Cohnella ginsengisoli TaxID=425004 RepID=A0A9X4QQN3_9BACL|nr:hypothetical protein [Cohnella ginsengisoli]MDG0794781.1 hypothetical protein [Cohnella ginsengisoli]